MPAWFTLVVQGIIYSGNNSMASQKRLQMEMIRYVEPNLQNYIEL